MYLPLSFKKKIALLIMLLSIFFLFYTNLSIAYITLYIIILLEKCFY